MREHSWNPLGEEDIVKQTYRMLLSEEAPCLVLSDTPIVSVK